MPRRVLAVCLLAVVAGSAATARAAVVAPGGKVRFDLGTEVFAWTRTRPLAGAGSRFSSDTVGLGLGRPVTIHGALGSSLIALGVGYGVHRHLIVGVRFGVNYVNLATYPGQPDIAAARVSTVVGTFTPYLEVLPVAEARVLPFFAVRTGFSGGVQTTRGEGLLRRDGALAPLVGVGVGAHAFATPMLSIDFGVTFDYRWTFDRVHQPATEFTRGWAHRSSDLTLAANLGLSTWF